MPRSRRTTPHGHTTPPDAPRADDPGRRDPRHHRAQDRADGARHDGLGKQAVAEHVGDVATVELLRELGVTHGQGFHLGKPQPLESLLAELQPAEEEPIGSA